MILIKSRIIFNRCNSDQGIKNLNIKKAAKVSGLKKDLGNELSSSGYTTFRRY